MCVLASLELSLSIPEGWFFPDALDYWFQHLRDVHALLGMIYFSNKSWAQKEEGWSRQKGKLDDIVSGIYVFFFLLSFWPTFLSL